MKKKPDKKRPVKEKLSVRRQLESLFKQIGLDRAKAQKELRKRVKKWKLEVVRQLGFVRGLTYDEKGNIVDPGVPTKHGETLLKHGRVWGISLAKGGSRSSRFRYDKKHKIDTVTTERAEAFNRRSKKTGAIWFEKTDKGWKDKRTKKIVAESYMVRSLASAKYWERVRSLRQILNLETKQAQRLYRALAEVRKIELKGVKLDVPEWIRSTVHELVTEIRARDVAKAGKKGKKAKKTPKQLHLARMKRAKEREGVSPKLTTKISKRR